MILMILNVQAKCSLPLIGAELAAKIEGAVTSSKRTVKSDAVRLNHRCSQTPQRRTPTAATRGKWHDRLLHTQLRLS